MPLTFNMLLQEAQLDLADVRLLRHADTSAKKGRTPYELWRDDRDAFALYQGVQSTTRQTDFGNASYWASFGATITGDTVFLGLYEVTFTGLGLIDRQKPHTEGIDAAGAYHWYELKESPLLHEYVGRVHIDWGQGARTWIQRPDNQNKVIVELRKTVNDPPFPGYGLFIQPLSRIEALPQGWKDALRSSSGIYLLTCPRTHEQYVGKADGADGFLGRWMCYVTTGHGDNVALKSREPSDYQVSILEVAGSSATPADILDMEDRWKQKLQSREMGLNRN